MVHVTLRRLLCALVVVLGLSAQAAQAQSVSVPFPAGFIGTIGQSTGKADSILNFATLGITQASFSQPSTNGQFGGTQGNDLSGTLILRLSDGTTRSIPGAINWRITDGGRLEYFGFIPNPANAAQTIPYNGGTYTLNGSSNYGLRKIGSTLAYPNSTNVSGNAALNGLLNELNAYLATVTANGPKITGSSGAAGATASAKTVDEGTTAVHALTADRAVTWSISGGADAARFAVNTSTGALTLLAAPDFEAPTDVGANNTYVVTLLATDSNGYTGQQTVTVTIADLDEVAPAITGPSGGAGAASATKTVPEGTTAVHTLTANETVTWSITGGADAARFAINATSGALTFLAAPDFEAPNDAGTNNVYDLVVTATDMRGNASPQAVAVTVTDLDELAPTITGPSGGAGAAASARSVSENQTAVHAFTASEPVTWSIAGGADAARFAISPTTGALSSTAAPDFELPADAGANNIYDIVVRATDTAGNQSQQAIAVTVTDLDDAAPIITGSSGAAGAAASAKSVDEGTTAVHAFTASEPVTWTITGGVDGARFAVDPSTGALTFVTPPDFERPADAGANNVYNLVLTATDAAGNVGQQTVAVTVLDLAEVAPVITGPSGASGAAASVKTVNEGTVTVHTFMANEPVAWSISDGTDAGAFGIDPATGALAFGAAPDFEAPADADTNNVYLVTVMATDARGNAAAQTVTVTVADLDEAAPTITGPSGGTGAARSAKSVNEGQTTVHTFTANEPVTWALVGGADAGWLALDPAIGALTFVAAPDFEAPTDADADNAYLVTLAATDATGNVSQQVVTVTVLDLDDTAPAITGPSGGAGARASVKTVDEGTTAVHAFMADEPVTWAVVGGADGGRLAIDPTTGALTFAAAPDFEAPADAEGNNIYLVLIAATDGNGNVAQQTVTVTVADLDDTAPAITGPSGATASVRSVNEGQTTVVTFVAGEAVTWAIVGGSDAARFAIGAATGALTFVAAPDFEVPADAGADNVYDLVVEATDRAGNASQQAVAVTALDVNEGDLMPPTITGPSGGASAPSSAKSVPENQVVVATLTADEPVTWSVTGGADAARLTIAPTTGALAFAVEPDFETHADANADNIYEVVVTATDANGNASQQTVLVTVTDVAEDTVAPVITGSSGGSGALSSAKNVPEGRTAVHAFTADEPATWAIIGELDAGLFAINPATGVLAFVVNPDYEAPTDADANNVYLITLEATDTSGNTSQQMMTVTVTDVPEDTTPPVVAGPSGGSGALVSGTSVNEGTTAVHGFTADEAVTWSLSGGADARRFAIGPATGALTFVAAPDFEAPADADADNVYLVTVTATDAFGNAVAQAVTVTVLNLDDPAPVITGPSRGAGAAASAKSVPENQMAVHAFTASEPVTWSITSSADAALFAIDPATGALSFLAAPDFDAPTDAGANNVYDLVVTATNATGNASQQMVAVTVLDLAEGDVVPPAITGPSGGAGAATSAKAIAEGLTAVATFTANEAVTWTVVGGADAAQFAVASAAGALTFVAAPDFEMPADRGADNVYVLVLEATDAAGNASRQTVTVTVTDVAEDSMAPVIAGPSGNAGRQAETVAEGSTAVTALTANEAVTWSATGGPDAGAFAIDPVTGALTFVAPPDFAAPTDADGDNVYTVKVTATDASGNATEIQLEVTVTDGSLPVIAGPSGAPGAATSARTVDEGATAVATVTADEAVTWAIAGGPDAARFVLDPATGELRFAAPQDFEAPTDTGTDNVYVLVVAATDRAGNVSRQTLRVTVADLPEDRTPPEVTGPSGTGGAQAETVAEGTTVVYTFAADEDVAWSLGGADGDQFVIDPLTGELRFRTPPVFGAPTDADGDNIYQVSVLAADSDGNETELLLTVIVTDTEAPRITGPSGAPGATTSATIVDEGGTAVVTFTADEAVTWSLGGADGGDFVINPATGALAFAAAPDFEAPVDADGDNVYLVVVIATDAAGNVSRQTVTVTVASLTDTPSELFEERRDEVGAIVADVESSHLRAAVASTQNMVRSARDRFIDGQRLRERCRDLEDDPITTTDWDDEACSPLASRNDVPFDPDGTLQVGRTGVKGAGTFFGQSGSFDGARRRIVSGDFQIVDDGEAVETFALNGRIVWERLVSEDVMVGYFLGGGYGESTVEQGLSGTITKGSLSFGGYVVAEPTDDLYLDGFASLGLGRNDLALSDDELDLEGDYDTRSLLVGGALSGVVERRAFEVRPELSVAYGLTDVGDVSLDATAFGTSTEVATSIDGVSFATVRFTPEVLIPLHRASGNALLEVAPSLLCEGADGERACGGGLRLGLRGTSEDRLTSFEVGVDADLIRDTSRVSLSASVEHRF